MLVGILFFQLPTSSTVVITQVPYKWLLFGSCQSSAHHLCNYDKCVSQHVCWQCHSLVNNSWCHPWKQFQQRNSDHEVVRNFVIRKLSLKWRVIKITQWLAGNSLIIYSWIKILVKSLFSTKLECGPPNP